MYRRRYLIGIEMYFENQPVQYLLYVVLRYALISREMHACEHSLPLDLDTFWSIPRNLSINGRPGTLKKTRLMTLLTAFEVETLEFVV